MRKVLLSAVLSAFISILSTAQDLTFYGVVPSYSQTGIINKKFDYNFFASTTTSIFSMTYADVDYPAKLLQVYIQPSIIYKFRPNLNFSASITYNYQRSNPNANYFNEWRGWQQAIFSHNPFRYKGRLSHRVRFEERLIKNSGEEYRLTTRLRYQIGYTVPLQGRTMDAHEFYFNSYCEFYFSISNPPDRPRNALHSEDWLYAGLGYHTGKMGRIEVGPIFQTNVRDRQHDRRNLGVLQILWVTNFNFRQDNN
ncbi:MAG: DUF2490 domain-containing protein [Cytophagaceae bacterium]|nr:DUF2490 domain-containing protein [Cytophagaceae bacterium]